MDAKQAYKQAYRMWRIYQRWQQEVVGHWTGELYNEANNLITATCGETMQVHHAYMSLSQRTQEPLDNEFNASIRRHFWKVGRKSEAIQSIKLYQPYRFPWKYEPAEAAPEFSSTRKVKNTNHDPHFLHYRKTDRNVKRGLVNLSRWSRSVTARRNRTLTCFTLNRAGYEALFFGTGGNDDDQPGGGDDQPTPVSPFPMGMVIAEMAY